MTFDALFAELAADRGVSDPSDEHDRYAVYVEVLESGEQPDLLLRCVAKEPDEAMATSFLAKFIEVAGTDRDLSALLAIAPESGRDFLERRGLEIALLDSFNGSSAVAASTVEELLAGTDWLQRRVALHSTSRDGLAQLAERGNTRRIRHDARQRLREITADAPTELSP